MSIYKYMSSEVAQFVLSNQVIRFTQPIAFNDPYDVYPRLSKIISDEKYKELFLMMTSNEQIMNELVDRAIEQQLPQLTPELKNLFSVIPIKKLLNTYIETNFNSFYEFFMSHISPDRFRDQFITYFLFMISNQVGILSLSKICDNLLMWSHYGNCHKGVVIEFDDQHPFLQQFENGVFQETIEINYTNKRPEFMLETFEPTLEESMELSKKVLFTKAVEWTYEKEFRVIRYLNNAIKLDYLDRNGYEIFVYEFPKDIIRGIIWGSKIEPAQKEKITELIISKGYSKIIYKQAGLSPEDYIINVVAT